MEATTPSPPPSSPKQNKKKKKSEIPANSKHHALLTPIFSDCLAMHEIGVHTIIILACCECGFLDIHLAVLFTLLAVSTSGCVVYFACRFWEIFQQIVIHSFYNTTFAHSSICCCLHLQCLTYITSGYTVPIQFIWSVCVCVCVCVRWVAYSA